MENSKSYFNISELAKELDVKKSHIRFCEEKGLISPRITMMKRRIYSRYDRARLKLILHCVLIGYSQDQIVELIGTPDVNLDEIGQIRKSLEYGEKKLDELVKLSRELKFHQRTGVRAEVNMMHEYVEELKTMKPAVVDEPTAEPYILDEDREETAPKPVKVIKPEIEKKPARKPARMVPVYVVGLVLVFIIAGFFYYQSSKKETKTLNLAQKEPIKTETHSVYHSIVPSDNTDDQKTLPLQPSVAEAPVPEKAPAAPEKEEVVSVPEKKVSKPQVKEGSVTEKPVVEKPAVVPDSVKVLAAAPAVEKEKAPKAEVAKEQEPPPPVAVAPVPKDVPAAPAKEEVVSVPEKKVSKPQVKEGIVTEKPVVEKPAVVPDSVKVLAATPAVEKEKAPKAEVAKEQEPPPPVAVAPVPKDVPAAPAKEEVVSVPEKKVSKPQVKEGIVTEKPVVEKPAVVPDSVKVLAATPAVEKEKAPKAEVAKEQEPPPPVAVAPVPKDVPAAPAKEEVVSVPEKKVSKPQVKEGIVTEKPVVEKPAVVPDSVKVLAATPAVEKEKAPKAEVAKEQEPPPPVAEAPVPEKAPAAPEKEEPVSVPDLQASEAEVKERPAIEESDIEAQPVETNTDKLLAARPEVDSPEITEESTPAIETEDKEILASKGETLAQQDQEERLKSFLRTYCRTYESKDIDKFAAFFAPDAVENETPFQDMLPKYRKNMEKIESFSYRIELVAYSLQTDTGNVKIQGDYFTRYLLHKGTWKEGSGSISMELTNSGDSYLVKQLNYGK